MIRIKFENVVAKDGVVHMCWVVQEKGKFFWKTVGRHYKIDHATNQADYLIRKANLTKPV